MGCGPGLYTQALAERKHHCVGVDFSPASIDYARQQGARCDPKPEYILEDIRNYRSNQKSDCIIMTFGEFNIFTRQDAAIILENCAHMLRDENGLLIMETHTYDAVRAIGEAPATWLCYATGLFSAKPHLCLRENSWNDADASALSRYFSSLTRPARRYGNTPLSCRPIILKPMWKCSLRRPCPCSEFSAKKSGVAGRISVTNCKHSSAGKYNPARQQQRKPLMIETQSWLAEALLRLKEAFGPRLAYLGLQGSYRR